MFFAIITVIFQFAQHPVFSIFVIFEIVIIFEVVIRIVYDIKTVSENLGHATVAFTLDVYGHVTEKMKKDSADRMQAFIQSL